MTKEHALDLIRKNREKRVKINPDVKYKFTENEAADMLMECEEACGRGDYSYDYQITEMKMVGLTLRQLYDKYSSVDPKDCG